MIWERNVCGDDCVSVEAEFCLAESGNMLYYGDVAGRVRAVNVAAFATEAPSGVPSPMPSQAPSMAPAVPSVGPSLIPSPMPSSVPSAAPTIISSAVPTIGATEETTGVPSAGTGSGNDDTGDNDGSGGTGDTDGAGEIDDTEGPGDTDDTDSAGNADGAGDSDDADDTGDTVSDGGDDAAALDKEVAGITGDSPPGSSGLSGKPLAYIGIAGGVLFLLSVLGCLFIFFLRKRSVVSKDKQRDLEAAEEKEKWRGEKNAYDKACKDAEKETLTELGVKGKVVDSLPRTPSTALASISETPDDPKETHAKQRDEELGEEIGFEMSITDSSQPQTRSLLPKNLTKRFAKSTTYSNSVPEFTRTGSDTDLKQRDSFDAPSVGGDTLNSASYAGYSDIQSTTEASASKDAAPPSIDGMNAASILQDMVRNKKRQTEKPATSEDQVDDELAAVNAALGNSGGVQSDNEEEPGRIQAGERKRPEPLPLPDEIARAASPFSDMLSVDSSLYYDESTVGTYSKKDCPDDESSRVSYSLGSLLGFGSSGRKPPTPVPEQESSPVASPSQDPPRPSPVPEPPKEAERAVPLPVSPKEPRVPVADKELVKKPDSTALLPEPAKASPQASRSVLKAAPVAEDTKMSIKLPKSKAQPQMEAQRSATAISIARDRREFHDNSPSRKLSHAGVSVRRGRSRAGLFTRRAERSNSDRSDSTRSMEPSSPAITRPEITPDGGTVSEVEELAYTAPKKVAHFEEARGQDKRSQKTNKPDSQETHNKEDAWNSFLSELSKAEATFFNPNDVEPPRSHSRSPSPPPPPPPRA